MVKYTVKEHKLEDVTKAVRRFVAAVKELEPETLFYEAFQQSNACAFTHFMCFMDRKAEDKHASSPHAEKFVNALYPACEKEPEFIDLRPVKTGNKS